MAQGINREFSNSERILLFQAFFELSINSNQQFLKFKRFFDVVIRACFETDEKVVQIFFLQ